MIPYSLVRVRKERDYAAFNPVHNRDKIISHAGYRILEYCDGAHPVEIIAGILANEMHMEKAEAMTYVTNFLDELSREGMIAWRGEASYKTKLPAPRQVFWDITAHCNLRCVHCYNADEKPDDRDLSTEQVKRTLDELSEAGVQTLTFSGGEPFIRKDFVDLVTYAAGLGFGYVSVATNGTLLDRDTARQLKHPKLYIQVSIDGDVAEIHDRMRGVAGCFDEAVRGLQALLAEGVQTKVCTTATLLNVDRVPEIIQLMKDLGVTNHRVQGVTPAGRGKKNAAEIMLPPGRMKRLMEYLISRNMDPQGLSFTLGTPPDQPVDFSGSGVCSAGNSYCSITSDGYVVPCTYFPATNAENVRQHTFQWIWDNSTLLNYFRNIKLEEIKGHCRECKWFMRCRGGCRAECYLDGDLFGSNRDCWVAEETGHRFR